MCSKSLQTAAKLRKSFILRQYSAHGMENKSYIPKFTGASYNNWAVKILYGLVEKRLISVVCEFKTRPKVDCPVPITPLAQGVLALLPAAERTIARDENASEVTVRNAEIEKWMELDLDAQAFIVKYLGASEQTHIRHCDTAAQMWESLKSFYELQGDIEIANAHAQLSAIIMGETEEIAVYVRRLQDLHSLLDRLKEPVSAAKQATNLLNSLNTRYFGMIDIIQTWSQTAPHLYTVQNILSTLQQKEVRTQINARKRGDVSDSYNPPPQVNYGGAPAHRNNGSGSSGGGMGVQCHQCNKYGHIKAQCTTPPTCSGCNKIGHTLSQCFQNNGGGAGNNTYGGAQNMNGGGKWHAKPYEGKREYIKCDHCGKPGHKAKDCRQRLREMHDGAANRAANNPSTQFDASQSLSYTATSHCFAASADAKLPLILDSGATDHIFPSLEHFSEYSTDAVPLGSRFIYTADDKPHEVKGSGVVTLRLHQGMGELTVRLHALHVPTLGQTLVSLSCINRRGGIAFQLSKNGTPTLTKDDKPWADIKSTRNGLLLLSGHIVMPGMVKHAVEQNGKALTVGTDWHLRLGHPGLTMMHAMSSKGLIPKLTTSESTVIATCEVCCKSKMAQSPHPAENEDSQKCGKLDRIHLDLVGPLSLKSHHGGYSYIQTGIDVGTRLSFVNLLKSKGDALPVSKAAIAALEVESDTNLKSLRTDGGGEYVSAAWKQYAQVKGFTHELTAPYSPQSNGMAERLNRTLLEKMRCLLIWSELPKPYWDVALLHSNWLRNRTPTSALKGGIPLEAWIGKQPNFEKIHTFGCLVQYLKVGHDKEKQSNKFASKTSYAIFLGMPKNQAGYLIWDPTRSDILVRDDVRFYDDIPGYPRLVLKKNLPKGPRDSDFFTLFPMEDGAAVPPSTPTISAAPADSPPPLLQPASPIDAIQLSSDSESGADDDNNEDEEEDDGEPTQAESIADRVAARRRANFAAFGDVL